MARQIVVELVGDSKQLSRSFDAAGASSKEMANDFENAADRARVAGEGFDRAAEGADTLDTRAMGLGNTLTGVQDVMGGTAQIAEGDLLGGITTLAMGVSDFGAGLYNFVIPSLKSLSASTLASGASAVKSSAMQVAAWATVGAKSLIGGAKVAAAWLLAMGPIAIVIAAVTGIVALIIANWDKIKGVIGAAWNWVRNTTAAVWNGISGTVGRVIGGIRDTITNVWNGIVGFVGKLPGRIGRAVSGLWNGITTGFKEAINWVIRAWNGLGFTLGPFDLPVIGKIGPFHLGTPDIPTFHQGGIVPGVPGSDVPAILQAGERVIPRMQSGRGEVHIHFHGPVYGDGIDELANRLALRLQLQGA